MNHSAAITIARARYARACRRLAIARLERRCAATLDIYDARCELAAAYCARTEAASVGGAL